jgi:WD40 repeat protein
MATQSNDEKPFLKFHPRRIGEDDHCIEHLSFSKDGRWLATVFATGYYGHMKYFWSAKEAWQTGLGEKQEFNPQYDYDGNHAFTSAYSEREHREWAAYNGTWMVQNVENLVQVYPHFDRFIFTRSESNDASDNNLFKRPHYISPDGRRIAVSLEWENDIKIWDQDEHDRKWRDRRDRDPRYRDSFFNPTGDFSRLDSLSQVHSLALSQDGKLLAASSTTGDVVVWDISSKSRVFETAVNGDSSYLIPLSCFRSTLRL